MKDLLTTYLRPPPAAIYYSIEAHANREQWPDHAGLPAGYWLDSAAADSVFAHWMESNPEHKRLAARFNVRVTQNQGRR